MRHRRAPSGLSFTPYEDTLESPTGELLIGSPNGFQLPSKDLNGNDIINFIVKNFANKSENSEQDKGENSDSTLKSQGQKIQICEKIEIFSEVETENTLDELKEMMAKIRNRQRQRNNKLEGRRKEIKLSLEQTWKIKGVGAAGDKKGKNGMEPADFRTGGVDNGVLVKVEENVRKIPRHRKKSVQFRDF